MGVQTVANNPLGSYPVLVDRTDDGYTRQAVGIDIGTVTDGVLTESRVSSTNPLPVTGTVTVDTSLLATAAKQDIGNASLSVLDDWDESDRAKVNLIASQAGIDGGSGASSAKTVRTILATDQPAVPVSPGDVSYTDTLTSLNDTVGTTVEVKHGATISIRVYGTFSQTIAFEWSPDNSNWQAWTALSKISREVVGASYAYILLNDTGALSGTSRYVYETWIPSGYFRCKTTSFTSGTANIGLYLDLNTTDPFTFLAYTGKINEAYQPRAALQLGAQTTSGDIFAPVPQNDTYGLHTYSYIRGGALANTQAGFYGFGNLTAAGQSVTADLDVSGFGFSSLTVEITGTFTGATLIFERKGYDSSGNFYATKGFDDVNNVLADTLTTISTGNRSLVFDCDSCTSFRVRCTALASGTVTIYIMSSSSGGELKRVVAVGTTAISAASLPLPSGAATSANQTTVIEQDPVSGADCVRVMGYDLDSSSFNPIPTVGFGTLVPVSVNAGIYGAGIGGTGSITGAAQTVILNTLNGYNEGVITVGGTYSATFAFEALKNATWYSIPVWRADGGTAAETSSGALVNVSRAWRFNVAGFDSVRIRCSTYVSGTATIEIQMTSFGVHTSQTLLPTGQTTMANSQSVSIASDQTVIPVGGDVAHDAADSGNPVKIGGKAKDLTPNNSVSDVAADDRVNGLFNLDGGQATCPVAHYTTLSDINTTYNNTTTTATSANVLIWRYRQATFSYEITKANSPTSLLFEFEISLDGTNYASLTNDGWGSLIYSATTVGSGVKFAYTFPIAGYYGRVKVTATGTTASATFTVANATLYLRD